MDNLLSVFMRCLDECNDAVDGNTWTQMAKTTLSPSHSITRNSTQDVLFNSMKNATSDATYETYKEIRNSTFYVTDCHLRNLVLKATFDAVSDINYPNREAIEIGLVDALKRQDTK
jgi:hypothetical protein